MSQSKSSFNLEQLESRFLDSWQRLGTAPDLAEFLADLDFSQRRHALQVLIPIDIQQRFQAGENVRADLYSPYGDSAIAIAAELFSGEAPDTPAEELQTRFESAPSNSDSESCSVEQPETAATNLITDRYRLINKIGQGGMGTVWLAQQEKPMRRRVAIKIIGKTMDSDEALARFGAERQALAMMNHPNIAKVLDAGMTEDGRPFFAMELVKGIPITKYCDDHRLSIEKRLELMIPVCEAVQHAHQKGIIHRDLKPSNILVCFHDEQPIAKVIDFGLAKALEHTARLTEETLVTEVGRVVGTLQYMSPEQAGSSELDVDTRSDIYSLGVILYQLLTDAVPLETDSLTGKSLIQIVEMIRDLNVVSPSKKLAKNQEKLSEVCALRKTQPNQLARELEGELDWIVLKSLEHDRLHRYQTANGLALDIQRYLNNEPIQARPPSRAYMLKKFIGNNRGLVYSLASIATLLLLGLGYISYQASELAKANNNLEFEKGNLQQVNEELSLAQNTTERQKQEAYRQLEAYLASFKKLDPTRGGDQANTAVDILSDAASSLVGNTSIEKGLRAKMLFAIGDSFLGLGEYDKAASIFEKVRNLSYDNNKNLAFEAAKYQIFAISDQQKQLPDEDRDPEKSLRLFKQIYNQYEESHSPNFLVWIDTRYKLGIQYLDSYSTYKKLNRDAPEQYVEKAIEHLSWAFKNSGTLDNIYRASVQDSLARAYREAGEYEKALSIGKKVVDDWKRIYDQPPYGRTRRSVKSDYLQVQNNYAKTLHESGRTVEAIELIKQVIENKQDLYASVSHPSRRSSIRLLIRMLTESKQYDEAQKVIDETKWLIADEKSIRAEKLANELSESFLVIERDLEEFAPLAGEANSD